MRAIRPAANEDLLPLLALLEAAGLPREGVRDEFPAGYAVIDGPEGLVAAAGVETYGDHGLLRSVAVAADQRGQGLGTTLVRERVVWAGARGLSRVWLLTTTAGPFFRALGFEPATRDAAPAALAASPELAHACPASAECLALDLTRVRRPGKIISGGQTGADRAALDAARELGIPRGGWVPRGRKAEDGPIAPTYEGLTETPSDRYAQRTAWNVRDADATVLFTRGPPSGGSKLTLERATKLGRPALHLDLDRLSAVSAGRALRAWLLVTHCSVLNVAGSRASQGKEIGELTRSAILTALGGATPPR